MPIDPDALSWGEGPYIWGMRRGELIGEAWGSKCWGGLREGTTVGGGGGRGGGVSWGVGWGRSEGGRWSKNALPTQKSDRVVLVSC